MAAKFRPKKQAGISPAGKAAILLVIFGIPVLFFASSYGLSVLFDVAPYAVVAVFMVFATVYTAQTAGLMYEFYEVDKPIMRFVPCLCEVTLLDLKYHRPCYILYAGAIFLIGASQLPYDILKILGEGLSTRLPFYLVVVGLLLLAAIQVIKGIGLMQTMKDISNDWNKRMHTSVGVIDKLTPLGFIPFVRVIALYSLNKPLSTLVSFMGLSSEDLEADSEFYEE